jgi:hypothetical protein
MTMRGFPKLLVPISGKPRPAKQPTPVLEPTPTPTPEPDPDVPSCRPREHVKPPPRYVRNGLTYVPEHPVAPFVPQPPAPQPPAFMQKRPAPAPVQHVSSGGIGRVTSHLDALRPKRPEPPPLVIRYDKDGRALLEPCDIPF